MRMTGFVILQSHPIMHNRLEQVQSGPVRKKKKPDRLDPSQPGLQHKTAKQSNPSPRTRKRQQSMAKYRKQEGLRTVMKVKERWVVRDKEKGQAVTDEDSNVV